MREHERPCDADHSFRGNVWPCVLAYTVGLVAWLVFGVWQAMMFGLWLLLPWDWYVRLPGNWNRSIQPTDPGRRYRVFSDGRTEWRDLR